MYVDINLVIDIFGVIRVLAMVKDGVRFRVGTRDLEIQMILFKSLKNYITKRNIKIIFQFYY